MIYLLDTTVLIDLLRTRNTIPFIEEHLNDELLTSSICIFEVYCGIYRLEKSRINLSNNQFHSLLESFRVVEFTQSHAQIAGEIQANLAMSGTLLEDMDILIAASAIAEGATLVTSNSKHFKRIKNLSVISP